VERNGCDPDSITDESLPDVRRETWTGCEQGTVVEFYTVAEAGHTWPGSDFGERFGGTTEAISATDLIWAFFAQHPKSK